MKRSTLLFLLIALVGVYANLSAQFPMKRTLQASRTASPVIDGIPDEVAWMQAEEATEFYQFEPREGMPASERSSVRILYDDEFIYIAGWLYDSEPSKIVRKLARRDDEVEVDAFTVMIDSYFDRKTAYVFGVNASGSQIDGIITNDGQSFGGRRRGSVAINRSWDAVWMTEVALRDWGWSFEMRIPYSMLRFSEAAQQRWGINFRRYISRKAEVADWVMVPRTQSGYVSHFGVLGGIERISPRRNIQFLPYSLSKYETGPDFNARFPRSAKYDAGADFKIGIANNMTLDATINPDFGQIDADPAELNLSTYETFFPERRQFFLEGVQIFDFNLGMGDAMLYTRRIGAQRPIIGALKVSGRTSEGLSIGMLDAVTGRNWGPERNFAVLRVKQELNTNSYLGSMLTSFTEFTDPSAVVQNWTGGADWDLRFDNNTYTFAGEAVLSNRLVSGHRQTGYGGRLSFDKIAGVLTFHSGLRAFSPEFNLNDVGRLRRSDIISGNAGIGYSFNNNEPFGPFRRARMRMSHWSSMNFAGTYLGGSIQGGFGAEFMNFWNGNLGFSLNQLGGYDDRETRGNGYYRHRPGVSGRIGVSSDSRQMLVYGAELGLGRDDQRRRDLQLEFDASLKIGTGFQLSGSLEIGRTDDAEAWVRNVYFTETTSGWRMEGKGEKYLLGFSSPQEREAFSGLIRRYLRPDEDGEYKVSVFTDRDTRQVDLTLRGDIILTRSLSFQLYAQTFIARIDSEGYRLLLDPKTFHDFGRYPIEEDFHRKNLNFNSVLRWEYHPGSVLYLVWSQARSFRDVSFGPREITGLTETFDVMPSNVFMLKLSYLLMP